LQTGNAAEQEVVRHAITTKSADQIDQVMAAVKRCGSLDYTRARARHHHDLALESLSSLSPSEAQRSLERITELSINRDH
jgi:octaprenyl-diphosphate synthase